MERSRDIKTLKLLILMIGVFFIGLSGVKADYTIEFSGDNAIQITESKVGVTPAILSSYLHTYYRKTTTTTNGDGKIVYCYDANKPYLTSTTTYSNCSTVTSNTTELAYIFRYGYGGSNSYSEGNYLESYFITQLAAWKFANPDSLMNGFRYTANNTLSGIYCDNDENCGSNEITEKVAELVNAAMSYSGNDGNGSVGLTASNNDKNMTLTSDKNYYISKGIKLSGNNLSMKSIKLNLTGPTGAFITKDQNATSGVSNFYFEIGDTVYVKVPASSVDSNFSVTLETKNVETNKADGTITRCSAENGKQSIMGYEEGNSKFVSASLSLTGTAKVSKEVKIKKVDSVTGQVVSGAKLLISGGNNYSKTITTGTSAETITLDPGTYTVKETEAPKGYIKSTEEIKFTIDSNGKMTVGTTETDTITMKNTPITVKISKTDSVTGQELEGAILVVKSGDNTIKTIETTGSIETINIPAGTYTLKETKAPSGYILSTEEITFVVEADGKIKIDGKEVTTIVMKNTANSIMISKTDSVTGKGVKGAILVIKQNGNVVKEIETDINPTPISLKPGEYTIEETEAPSGYIKNTKVIKFTITDDNKIEIGGKETSYVEMKNDPMLVYISKKSINGKTELPGATLIITDKDGKLVKDLDGKSLTWTTTTEQMRFRLAPGTYYLYETKAPKGYELSDKKLEFTVDENGQVKMNKKDVDKNIIVYTNTPEAKPVQTGSLLIYIIIIGLISVGVITYYVIRQDKLKI